MSPSTAKAARRDELAAAHQAERERTARTRRRRQWAVSAVVVLVLGALVAFALLTSRPQSTTESRVAPGFTLETTAGTTVSLADYAGSSVILYFSEGAGCQACLLQMGEIEKRAADFEAAGITVLPIVMNTREQIQADMDANGVTTPFLLDDGTVSAAYDTLGKGMHEGLPGHSFVLIDGDGTQRWSGEYPSMWLDPSELLDEATSQLAR